MSIVIDTEKMYKNIKKQNGEDFAKILRENVLLDVPNLEYILKYAGKDPKDAHNLISVLREIRTKAQKVRAKPKVNKDPIELLSDAGYDAFYVQTLKQQNSIKKYFAPNEELCTFKDPDRYKQYYIIHAVKKDVKNIKRSRNPQREDKYGTSVISIQIAKTGGFISIKNRYNHTINNPDATFNHNPDNIISGLTASLQSKFSVNFMTSEAKMPDNYRLINGQLCRFNYEIDNVYFDEKYYFTGSEITPLKTSYEIMLDWVVLDVRNGSIRSVVKDSVLIRDEPEVLQNEISNNKIQIKKDIETGETIVNLINENRDVGELCRVKKGCITSLHLYKAEILAPRFLAFNHVLRELYAPKLRIMKYACFRNAEMLEKLWIPELTNMGSSCFIGNKCLMRLDAQRLKLMEMGCFAENEILTVLNIPELEKMENNCFMHNSGLKELQAQKLKVMGNACFCKNRIFEKLFAAKLTDMGDDCFECTEEIKEIDVPKLKKMGNGCFRHSKNIEKLNAPELEELGNCCFSNNKSFRELCISKLRKTKYMPECMRRFFNKQKFKQAITDILSLSKTLDIKESWLPQRRK